MWQKGLNLTLNNLGYFWERLEAPALVCAGFCSYASATNWWHIFWNPVPVQFPQPPSSLYWQQSEPWSLERSQLSFRQSVFYFCLLWCNILQLHIYLQSCSSTYETLEMIYICTVQCDSHKPPVASAEKKLYFYLILINLNVNSLLTAVLGSAAL